MAKQTAGDIPGEVDKKRDMIMSLASRSVGTLETLTKEVEDFAAWMFSENGNLTDAEDIAKIVGRFEEKRVLLQTHMDRLNTVAQLQGTTDTETASNVAAFIFATDYNHAAYSAQFDVK